MSGAVPYVPVDDLPAALARLRDAGAEERQSPSDVGGGRLIALVADADGNLTGYAGGLERKRFLLDLETPAGERLF